MLKIFKKVKDDSHEFKPLIVEIEEQPLSPLGRSILWIVIALILFLVVWFFFARIDIVISAQGKVIPNGEIKVLKPLETGVVSKILIKEGDRVKKGDVLMQIDPSVSKVNLDTKQKELASVNMSIARLEALGLGKELLDDELNKLSTDEKNLYFRQKNTQNNLLKQYQLKIEQSKFALSGLKEGLKRYKIAISQKKEHLKKLEKVKDIIAYKDYENLQKEIIDIEQQSKIANQKIFEAKKKLSEIEQELNVFKDNSKSKYLNELVVKEKEANSIKAQINTYSFQSQQQQILSPVDGYIGKLMINTEGGIVNSSEQLLSIIPTNEPLIIKANVLNKDIGYLKLNQKVAIKIETFNFQKYGKLDGKIINIGKDALHDEKLGEIYEIKVKPENTYLMVDGEKKEIEPGMSVMAEVKVGKRRVIELFIYPIVKYLDEGLSVR